MNLSLIKPKDALNEAFLKQSLKREQVESPTPKTEKEIEKKVYELYRLTEEEKRIVEESSK